MCIPFHSDEGKPKSLGLATEKDHCGRLLVSDIIQTSTSIMETIHYKLCLSMDIGQTFALRKFQDAFIWLCLKTGYPIIWSFFIFHIILAIEYVDITEWGIQYPSSVQTHILN